MLELGEFRKGKAWALGFASALVTIIVVVSNWRAETIALWGGPDTIYAECSETLES